MTSQSFCLQHKLKTFCGRARYSVSRVDICYLSAKPDSQKPCLALSRAKLKTVALSLCSHKLRESHQQVSKSSIAPMSVRHEKRCPMKNIHVNLWMKLYCIPALTATKGGQGSCCFRGEQKVAMFRLHECSSILSFFIQLQTLLKCLQLLRLRGQRLVAPTQALDRKGWVAVQVLHLQCSRLCWRVHDFGVELGTLIIAQQLLWHLREWAIRHGPQRLFKRKKFL